MECKKLYSYKRGPAMLTDDEMKQIDRISPQGIAAGGRFPGQA
ncbi:hypothetical protein [Paenibacillus sp. SAF-068]